MIKVSIVGATAFTSRELIPMLVRHPDVEIVHLGGRREGAPLVSEVFTSLRGVCDLPVTGLMPEDAPEKPDVTFFTLPHALSHQYVPRYLDAGIKCVDFSADYRFSDLAVYEAHYGEHGDPENVPHAVYGIPELFRDQIAGARLIGNPGCYPTSVALGLAPVARAGLIAGEVMVNSMSGVTGMGNKAQTPAMFCECNEDVRAYKVSGHRHEVEMEQTLQVLTHRHVPVTFVPHLVPLDRGILSTIVFDVVEPTTTEALTARYAEFYDGEPFMRVCPAGTQPRTKDVAHTNTCDVAVTVRNGTRVIVTSAIDNMRRGAASQAVQNMNCMLGLDERLGIL
jgi:N-acetyl-gamma-glutamyl-phosphate reductase